MATLKPHNTSSLNGLSLVKQIELTNTHKWMEIAHVTGSHFDSAVPDFDQLSGEELSKPELTVNSCSGKTFVID